MATPSKAAAQGTQQQYNQAADDLVDAIMIQVAKLIAAAQPFQLATVTSTSPLRVVLDKATSQTGAVRNAGYTPTDGDRVLVIRFNSQNIIAFKIVS